MTASKTRQDYADLRRLIDEAETTGKHALVVVVDPLGEVVEGVGQSGGVAFAGGDWLLWARRLWEHAHLAACEQDGPSGIWQFHIDAFPRVRVPKWLGEAIGEGRVGIAAPK